MRQSRSARLSCWARAPYSRARCVCRVFAVVAAEVVKPFPDRPTDGFLHLSVELSPMASAGFDVRASAPRARPRALSPTRSASLQGGRMSAQGIEIQRIIERSFRDSRAVDTEALCIVAGEKVRVLCRAVTACALAQGCTGVGRAGGCARD